MICAAVLSLRLPAVEIGNVAELAQVGAPARELQREHQVVLQRDEVVRRDREILQRKPVLGFEADLRGRARDALIEAGDQPIGGISHLADVEIVDVGIHLGRGGCRGAAQHHDLAGCVRALGDIVDLLALHVHAADQDDVGPFELGGGGLADILVDEADRPSFRHVRRDQEEALRRHEGAHPLHQPIGVVEGTERGRVMRKNAQDPASVLDWDRAAHATSHPLGRIVASSAARRKRLLFPRDFPCGPFVPGAGFR